MCIILETNSQYAYQSAARYHVKIASHPGSPIPSTNIHDTRPTILELIWLAGERWRSRTKNRFGAKNSTHRESAVIFQIRDLNSVENRVELMSEYASKRQTMAAISNQLIS